ncbi:MAG: ABC transporter ATP-binding protein, partial [Bacillota bacterium]|nr:ABC transporter ATP-binding protein [Bacillota bacterium]
MDFLAARDLSVGYSEKILISGINLTVESGKILTLIGPNGSGKSTILKTLTRHLRKIGGVIEIKGMEQDRYTDAELARELSVVLTDRVKAELMTCGDVVAMGRYPYTGHFGHLREEDYETVRSALATVGALDLEHRPFTQISDGQRQRIMLARAICQDPKVLVLDEPTSFLDIRHKIELLGILLDMAKHKHVAIVMSLHEIDLAAKVSDFIACVDGEHISHYGPPQDIITDRIVEKLYDLEKGSYNALFGSVELERPAGKPKVFVLAGGGGGVTTFRALQKKGIAFSAGILYQNDIDYFVAESLASELISLPAFAECTIETVNR